jgi:hypothetical protein
MRTLAVALVAGVSLQDVSLATPARAEPPVLSRSMVDNGLVKRPRYCDQHGRCWTEGYRNMLFDTYAYAPPPRYGKPQEIATGKAAVSAKALSGRVAKSR